jgi:hypothetical protein
VAARVLSRVNSCELRGGLNGILAVVFFQFIRFSAAKGHSTIAPSTFVLTGQHIAIISVLVFKLAASSLSRHFICNRVNLGFLLVGAPRRVLGLGTMLQAGRLLVRFTMRSFDFSINLIFPFAL